MKNWDPSYEFLGCACVLVVAIEGHAGAAQLITEEEAALPSDNSQVRAGVERGPTVVAIYPSVKSGQIKSPFTLQLKFTSHGGAAIDLDSVIVTYMKVPAIDLTARVKPFVQSTGVNIPDVEVPPGSHRILISIKDGDGRSGWADIKFNVAK